MQVGAKGRPGCPASADRACRELAWDPIADVRFAEENIAAIGRRSRFAVEFSKGQRLAASLPFISEILQGLAPLNATSFIAGLAPHFVLMSVCLAPAPVSIWRPIASGRVRGTRGSRASHIPKRSAGRSPRDCTGSCCPSSLNDRFIFRCSGCPVVRRSILPPADKLHAVPSHRRENPIPLYNVRMQPGMLPNPPCCKEHDEWHDLCARLVGSTGYRMRKG